MSQFIQKTKIIDANSSLLVIVYLFQTSSHNLFTKDAKNRFKDKIS
jgi:hypothetical protein